MNTLTKLPQGWQWAKMGEVCDVVKGITPRREWYTPEGVRVVKFRDVQAGKLNWQPGVNSYVPHSYIPKLRELRIGMTLVGADAHNPEYIGKKVCLVREIPQSPVFYSGELMSFQPKDAQCLTDEWSFLWLSSPQGYKAVQEKVSGMHLNTNPAKEIPIPLPPLSEQGRIIKVLNRQMAEVEKIRVAAEENLEAAQALPPALLRKVFNHNQTTPLPENWQWTKLGDICKLDNTNPPMFNGEKPYYDTAAVGIRGIKKEPVMVAYKLQNKGGNRPGRANRYPPLNAVGFAVMKRVHKVILVDAALVGAIFSTGFQFLIADTNLILPDFLHAFVLSNEFQYQKDDVISEGIMAGISKRDITEITIPLPPLPEQKRITKLLNHQMAKAETVRVAAEEALEAVNALPAALLRQTFKIE